MFKVIYADEVYDDIQNALDFYNSRGKGLGTRFLKSVKNQILKIKSNAFGFQVRYNNVRCIPINKFPYTIHYKVVTETNIIMIIAIFCNFQNPEIWEDRLK
jgi:hypothetical protein